MQPFPERQYFASVGENRTEVGHQRLVAFGRVMSGTLRKGQEIHVMGAKHRVNGFEDIIMTEVEHLFVFMGSNLESVDQVPAGNIVGIGGLDEVLIKTGTISSDPDCPNFLNMKLIS